MFTYNPLHARLPNDFSSGERFRDTGLKVRPVHAAGFAPLFIVSMVELIGRVAAGICHQRLSSVDDLIATQQASDTMLLHSHGERAVHF